MELLGIYPGVAEQNPFLFVPQKKINPMIMYQSFTASVQEDQNLPVSVR